MDEPKTKFGEIDWKLPVWTVKGHTAQLLKVIRNPNPMVVLITNALSGLQWVKEYPPSGKNWGTAKVVGKPHPLDLTNQAPVPKVKKKNVSARPSKGEKLKMLAEMGIVKPVTYGKKDDLAWIEQRKQEGYSDYHDGEAIRDADRADEEAGDGDRKTGGEK